LQKVRVQNATLLRLDGRDKLRSHANVLDQWNSQNGQSLQGLWQEVLLKSCLSRIREWHGQTWSAKWNVARRLVSKRV